MMLIFLYAAISNLLAGVECARNEKSTQESAFFCNIWLLDLGSNQGHTD